MFPWQRPLRAKILWHCIAVTVSLLLFANPLFAREEMRAFQLLMDQARANARAVPIDGLQGHELGTGLMPDNRVRAIIGDQTSVDWRQALREGMRAFGHAHHGNPALQDVLPLPLRAVDCHGSGGAISPWSHLELTSVDFNFAASEGPHAVYMPASLERGPDGWRIVALTDANEPMGFLIEPRRDGRITLIPMDGLAPILEETMNFERFRTSTLWEQITASKHHSGAPVSAPRPSFWGQNVGGSYGSQLLSALPGVAGAMAGAYGAHTTGLAITAAGAAGVGAIGGYLNPMQGLSAGASAWRGAGAGLSGFGGGWAGSYLAAAGATYLGAGPVAAEMAGHIGGGVGGYVLGGAANMLFFGESAAAAFGGVAAPVAAAGAIGGMVGTTAYHYTPIGGVADFLAANIAEGVGAVPVGTYQTMRRSDPNFWRR